MMARVEPSMVDEREQAAFRCAAAAYLLGYPDPQHRRMLHEVLSLVEREEGDPELIELARLLRADLADLDARGELAEEEYTGLFIANVPEPPCLPLESFYLEGTRVGTPTSAVGQLITSSGLRATRLPPDHAVSELELAQHLVLTGAHDPDAVEFVKGHLARWLPRWAQDVAGHAHHPFFVHAARFAVRVVERVRAVDT